MSCANFVLDQYARGVVRTAVDEGARAGALASAPGGPAAACLSKEREVMSGLLSGAFASGLHFGCALEGGQVVATVGGNLPSWLPPVPRVAVEETGVSELETAPQP